MGSGTGDFLGSPFYWTGGLQSGGLQSGGLEPGGLEARATDLGRGHALTGLGV